MKLREADLSWQEIDEDIVVLDLRASSYLRLNGTGATLWRALSTGADQDELVSALTSEYDVSADQAGRDVAAFVARLEASDLLAQSD